MSSDYGLKYIFGYVPSLSGATAMTAIYAIVSLVAIIRSNSVRTRGVGRPCIFCCRPRFEHFKPWHYTNVLPATCLIELIGYAERRNLILNFGAWPYLFSLLALLVAPVVLAIMNYKVIGHLLQVADQRVSCMSPRVVSSAIVAIDIICVILQFGGSVCATISIALQSTLITSISTNVLLISFVLQLVLNAAFTALIAWMFTKPTFSPRTSTVPNMTQIWVAIWTTVALLWIRNLYRAGEAFAVVAMSPPAPEEWFYALDTVPVVLCCIIFCISNFGMLFPVTDDDLRAMMAGRDAASARATASASGRGRGSADTESEARETHETVPFAIP